MCGICGIVSTNGRIVERDTVRRMATVIRHRGPDDEGVWTNELPSPSVGLGHRRLSIIDLSAAGHQPMTNEDGSLWLVYNGEIYNHAVLRQELEAAGHQYRSHTDSETILHAYEEWGDACVERFRGMFAFALWDTRRQRLTVVRDRLGVKPLYYSHVGGVFAFASEIKALWESGAITPKPTEGAVSEYLAFGYLAGPDTLFAGVRKLPPGHVLVWERGTVTTREYWHLRFQPDFETSDAELQRRFVDLFEESVRLRLMSDVPLGVFLSGGLDSSAIAAVMGRQVSGRLKTFSVGYESRYYSEFSFAREVAKHIGSEHHEVVLTADAFLESLPRLVYHEDEPLWAPPSVALYFVSELASREVKVVLTGEGSDELYAGYDRYWMTALNARALALFQHLPPAGRRALRAALVTGPLPERARRALSHTFFNHDTMPDGLFLDNWFGVFSPEWQRRIAGPVLRRDIEARDVYASHREFYSQSQATELVDRLLYTDIKTNLVELLMKQDQMSMATSIESRVPFLDHKHVEFAATVPPRSKIKGFSGKHLVKEALAGYLPATIRNRPKQGFPMPYESWLREQFAPGIEKLLLEPRAIDRGWVQPQAIKDLFAEHRSGRRNLSRQIWSLWGLELWARIFLDGERPSLDRPEKLLRRQGAAEAALV